jgi:hypothetical protein
MLDVVKKGLGEKKCEFDRRFLSWDEGVLKQLETYLIEAKRKANSIAWDDEVPRHFAHCTEMAGTARIACTYRELCMEGRGAALQYLTSEGVYLHKYEPAEGKEKMPWI